VSVYSYRCTLCANLFEEEQTIKEYIATVDNRKKCPKCKKTMVPSRVIMYPITAIYRGDGFTLRKKENESS
jgi:predicted nucleic acid-binding Zn ribbon protein